MNLYDIVSNIASRTVETAKQESPDVLYSCAHGHLKAEFYLVLLDLNLTKKQLKTLEERMG